MKTFHNLLLIGVLLLAGCAGVSLGTPRIWQERPVTALHSKKLLILQEPLTRTAHESMNSYFFYLPAGIYKLSAEDNDYFYFEGVSKVTLVVHKAYQPKDGRNQSGGIFIAKNGSGAKYPGGVFVDWDDGKMLQLVTLDTDFFGAEGRFWHYQN